MNNLTFGQAIEALNAGRRVCRGEGDGTFIFRQVPSEIPAEVIPRMTSLPEEVKAHLSARGLPLNYRNQFAIVLPNSEIHGWAPTPGDSLANDWRILEPAPVAAE